MELLQKLILSELGLGAIGWVLFLFIAGFGWRYMVRTEQRHAEERLAWQNELHRRHEKALDVITQNAEVIGSLTSSVEQLKIILELMAQRR